MLEKEELNMALGIFKQAALIPLSRMTFDQLHCLQQFISARSEDIFTCCFTYYWVAFFNNKEQ